MYRFISQASKQATALHCDYFQSIPGTSFIIFYLLILWWPIVLWIGGKWGDRSKVSDEREQVCHWWWAEVHD